MTQPATGTTWDSGGFNDVDNRFLDRGGKIAVLVRDNRGAATNISPRAANGDVAWSPFAQDGTWRNDLMAWRRVNGIWTKVATPNLGFHLVGAFKEGDGPKRSAKIDIDDYKIEQENWPFDSDIIGEDEPFSFTGVETLKDWVERLHNNLRLNDPDTGETVCSAPGSANYVLSKPTSTDPIDRQVLLMRDRRIGGRSRRVCTGFSLGTLNNIGDSSMGKRDADAPELTFKPLPDPFFMDVVDGEFRPVLRARWIAGEAWSAMGAPAVPVVSKFIVDLGGATGGDFLLTFKGETTTPIAAGASAPTAVALKNSLIALDDGYKAADWTVTGANGGPFEVTTPGGPLTGNGAGLTGGTGLEITPA